MIGIQIRQSLIGNNGKTDGILPRHIGRLLQAHIFIENTSDTGCIKYKQLSPACQQRQIGGILTIRLAYGSSSLLRFFIIALQP